MIGTASEEGDFVWATQVLLGAESYEAFRTNLDQRLEPFAAASVFTTAKQ